MEIENLKELMDERDRRYTEKFKAQEEAVHAALVAQKELTNSAFIASEKAIVKAEEAQKSYNQTHNDLSRKMDQQYADMIPRPEATAQFQRFDEKIEALKKELDELRGEKSGKLSQLQLISLVVGIVAALALLVFKFV